jgi:hypothetical protein
MSMRLTFAQACALLPALCMGDVSELRAQWQSQSGPATAALGAVVGSDVERYVRALSMTGIIKPIPWGARPFGADELREFLQDPTVQPHPWRAGIARALDPHVGAVVAMSASANSAFPWGANDGAMWQGRGVTTSLGAAATVRWGAFSAVAAPVAFSAQNAAFRLIPVAGDIPFRDGVFPTAIDLPQRMGAGRYSRVSPGESSVRLRLSHIVGGITTASLGWGTGEAFPAIFGSNAGGFSHVFLGTAGRGVRIPAVGRVSARYVLGVLEQSPWSPVQGSTVFVNDSDVGRRRIGSGLTLSFMPSLLPTLELGLSRFYHSAFTSPSTRWDAWSKPVSVLYKRSRSEAVDAGGAGPDTDNQLAAFFPHRGVEASFELLREDHNWDARDLAQEPENNSAVLASFRTIVRRSSTGIGVLTLEYFDGDVRPIAQQRSQGSLYAHQPLRQGHTARGQLLGAPIGVGAISGARAGFERFTTSGSVRYGLQRWRVRSARSSDPEALYRAVNYPTSGSHDWILDATMGASVWRTHQSYSADVGVAWAGVWQFSDPKTNWYARFGWTMF